MPLMLHCRRRFIPPPPFAIRFDTTLQSALYAAHAAMPDVFRCRYIIRRHIDNMAW